jgi:hypothetical protein
MAMTRRSTMGLTLVIVAFPLGWARADFESDLLQKFQHQNKQAMQQLKLDVAKHLAQAAALCPTEPEKALDLLRKSQQLLNEDEKLARADRADLLRQVDERVREAKERLKSKQAQAAAVSSSLYRNPQPPAGTLVSPPLFFTPNLLLAPVQAAVEATPVVSPDRRYVRIGVRGAFAMPTMGPLVPTFP